MSVRHLGVLWRLKTSRREARCFRQRVSAFRADCIFGSEDPLVIVSAFAVAIRLLTAREAAGFLGRGAVGCYWAVSGWPVVDLIVGFSHGRLVVRRFSRQRTSRRT